MKLHYFALLGALLAMLGCKTTHVASAPGAPPLTTSTSTNRAQKAVPIDQSAFSVIATSNQLESAWLQMPTNLFRLGPGDMIEIEVLGEGASRSAAMVGPDGKIYFSLLPGTFVWGLTLSEAKKTLEDGLQRFFREKPQLSLTLREVTSQRVWILGQVQAPGVYPLATPMTLLDAMARAGGTAAAGSSEADLRNSFVLRDGKLLGVDFYRLLRKGDLTQNIYLEPDDFVYVRPGIGQTVYVLGAVRRSGPVPFTDKISLLTAVASASSTVPYAKFWDVVIIRGSLTNPTVASVNYRAIAKGQAADVLLEPGDIVYVPFSPFQKIGELANRVLREFVGAISLNEGIRAVNRQGSPVPPILGVGGGFEGSLGAGPFR